MTPSDAPDDPGETARAARETGDLELATIRESTGERRENGVPRTRKTVTGDHREDWLRVENAPPVRLAGPESPPDDEPMTGRLRSRLER